jgi:hypothetical protein
VPKGFARIIAFMLSDEAGYLRGALFTRQQLAFGAALAGLSGE